MPRCQVSPAGPTFTLPPESIRSISAELYEYLLATHARTFGFGVSGDLDGENVNAAALSISHTQLTNIQPYQHHGADAHAGLVQATALANADTVPALTSSAPSASTVVITTADADATYDAAERDLLNELKADVNTLVTNVNALITIVAAIRADTITVRDAVATTVTQLNGLLARLRTAALLASS